MYITYIQWYAFLKAVFSNNVSEKNVCEKCNLNLFQIAWRNNCKVNIYIYELN